MLLYTNSPVDARIQWNYGMVFIARDVHFFLIHYYYRLEPFFLVVFLDYRVGKESIDCLRDFYW